MSKRYFIIRDCNKLPLRGLDRIDGLASWGVWTLQCCQELVWFALGPAQEQCLFCFYSRGDREIGTPWRCGREGVGCVQRAQLWETAAQAYPLGRAPSEPLSGLQEMSTLLFFS